MTGGGVPKDFWGRLSLPRWVQLVLGSHAWGLTAFGAPNQKCSILQKSPHGNGTVMERVFNRYPLKTR